MAGTTGNLKFQRSPLEMSSEILHNLSILAAGGKKLSHRCVDDSCRNDLQHVSIPADKRGGGLFYMNGKTI